jgi:hypothetical protein
MKTDLQITKNYFCIVLCLSICILVLSIFIHPVGATSLREIIAYTEKYPVGSIYMTINNVNPNEEIGYGTWVRIAENRVLMGVNESDTNYSQAEMLGG